MAIRLPLLVSSPEIDAEFFSCHHRALQDELLLIAFRDSSSLWRD